jgi:catechol 2,3-dioxygenase-like lactoylglutathione lyase family enzyme
VTDADLSTASLGQIAIRVVDLDRAVAFYRDTLGLPLLFRFPGLAFFRAGDVRLMLSRPEQAEFDHPGSLLYFRVPDIAATHATLSDRGVRFRSAPRVVHRDPTYELWLADFTDTEGNPLALMAEQAV